MSEDTERGIRSQVIQLIVGEVPSLLSEWRYSNGNTAPDDATDLLSAWAHLQRFDPGQLPVGVFEILNKVVQSLSSTAWEDAVVSTLDPPAWREALLDLADDVDDYPGGDGHRANLIEARRLFDELDQAELALWAVRKRHKGEAKAEESEALEHLGDEISECLFAFEEEKDLFKELNSYITGLRSAYREDLLAFDSGLWWTVAKFDMVAEYAAMLAPPDQKADPFPGLQIRALPTSARNLLLSCDFRRAAVAAAATGYGKVCETSLDYQCNDAARPSRLTLCAEDGSWVADINFDPEWRKDSEVVVRFAGRGDAAGGLKGPASVLLGEKELILDRGRLTLPLTDFVAHWNVHPGRLVLRHGGIERPGRLCDPEGSGAAV